MRAWLVVVCLLMSVIPWSGFSQAPEEGISAAEDATPAATPEPTPIPFPNNMGGEWFVPALSCGFCDSMVGQEVRIDQPKTIIKYYDRVILEPAKESGSFIFKTEKVSYDLLVKSDVKANKMYLLYFDKGMLPRVGESFARLFVVEPMGDDNLLYGQAYLITTFDDDAFIHDEEKRTWRASSSYFNETRILALLEDVRVTTLDEDRRLFVASDDVRISMEGAFAFFRMEITSENLATARTASIKALNARSEMVVLFRTLVASGDTLYTQGKYDSAIAQYQAAGGIRPGESIVYANLGAVYQMQKKYIEAERTYQIASDLSPNDPNILFNLGAISEGQRQWERAQSLYKEVLLITPDDLDTQERLKVVNGMVP